MAIFTGIATAIAGALFGGSALATSLIGGALAFGAKFAIGKIQAAKQVKQKYTAVQGEIQFGGDVPVGTLYGVGKTKGQRAFYAKWDKGNKRNAEVFILANGWCDGL
ncbi:phage tail protein, partial [Sinorhizobium medicae]|nr:phage tail protein [Sinorhizobium medicae]MDX0581185.1 phage tail protein [Sinorhizobium medicae]MDX0784875.1 phage tail protein [Sinorhizobium medicae]